MRVYPHSASQWKRRTRPVVASHLPLASRRCLQRFVHKHDWSSRAAKHMLGEGVCAVSYVNLNLAMLQSSLAKQQRAFSHFSPSTTTVLAWKPDHSRTESTHNEMFVSTSTLKRSSSRPLEKSTSCIVSERTSKCMWIPTCPNPLWGHFQE